MKNPDFRKNRVWERIWAKGLIVECPYKISLEDCPLKEIRKLPIEERINIVDKMSVAELDTVLEHHKSCQKALNDIINSIPNDQDFSIAKEQ